MSEAQRYFETNCNHSISLSNHYLRNLNTVEKLVCRINNKMVYRFSDMSAILVRFDESLLEVVGEWA